MIDAPAGDDAVRGWIDELGLPGLFDAHVHFLPKTIMDRVWDHFDSAGPMIGRPWPINYRMPDEQRVATLRALGVRRFTSLPYAHKPGVAAYLNDWARGFAKEHDGNVWSATFYPEPEAPAYVRELVDAGVAVFKVHVQVGGFDPRDPVLDEVWSQLADNRTPVVVHAGSGPVPGRHTGAGPVGEVLERHPDLPMIVAHMGAPEYADFLALAELYENVRLDTTMAFTDFFESDAPYPRDLLPRLRDLEDRILLGSDFPNIPYSYAHQLEALVRLDLGDDWLRSVCWHNAATLFGTS